MLSSRRRLEILPPDPSNKSVHTTTPSVPGARVLLAQPDSVGDPTPAAKNMDGDGEGLHEGRVAYGRDDCPFRTFSTHWRRILTGTATWHRVKKNVEATWYQRHGNVAPTSTQCFLVFAKICA